MTKKIKTFFPAIMLLLAGSFIMQSCQEAIEGEPLFNQFYETYPNVIDALVKDEQPDLNQAMQLYDLEQYEEAKALFNQAEGVAEIDFYLGIIEIELEQYRKAEKLLLEVYNDPNHPFETPAKYYLGLLSLRENDFDQTKVYFNGLLASEGYEALKKRAQILLEEIP